MALAVSDVAYWRKCEAPQRPLFGSYLPGRSMLIWLTCEWRDAEVSGYAPHFRLLDYSRPTRHVPGTSKLTLMYGPAGCRKKFFDPAVGGHASMYPAFDWSVFCSWPTWISARIRSY